MSEMGFERALAALKVGRRVARTGWNGKLMWLMVVRGLPFEVQDAFTPHRALKYYRGEYPRHIMMRTATGDFVPWLASVTDLMAEDWMVVDSDQQRLTESAPV